MSVGSSPDQVAQQAQQAQQVDHNRKPSKAFKPTIVKVSEKSPMSKYEKKEKGRLETRAKKGYAEFFESLQEIREKKLYRQREDGTKRNWEEYCLEVFGQTKQNIDKDIRANATSQEIQKTETFSSDLILTREVLLILEKHPQQIREQVLTAAIEKAGNKRINVSNVKSVINSISPPQLQLGNKLPVPLDDDLKNRDNSDKFDNILKSLSEIEKKVAKLYTLDIEGSIIDQDHFDQLLDVLGKVFNQSQLGAFKSFLYNDFLRNIGK
jgi:membrane-associated HD superfamily phosphohydrolase